MADKINESTTFNYTAQLSDYSGAPLPLSAIEGVFVTVYDVESSTVLKETVDGFNANELSIDANGVLTYQVRAFETRFVAADQLPGSSEDHAIVFRFVWNSAFVNSLVGPFETFDESPLVTVTSPSHGLSVNDHVSLLSAASVGGMNMNGIFIVEYITDSNTYLVSGHCPATSNDVGGGAVTERILPDSSTHTYTFKVIKRAVNC